MKTESWCKNCGPNSLFTGQGTGRFWSCDACGWSVDTWVGNIKDHWPNKEKPLSDGAMLKPKTTQACSGCGREPFDQTTNKKANATCTTCGWSYNKGTPMSKKNKPVYLLDFVCPDCSSTLFYKANDMFTNAICICCERNFWLNPEDFTRNPSNKEKQMSSPEMYEVTILERNDQTLNVIVNVTTVTAKNRDAAIIKMAVGHLAQCLKKDGSINIDNLEVRTRPFVGTET